MINFPQNPAAGQVYTFSSKTWKWNGRAWDLQTISDTQVARAEAAAIEAANQLTTKRVADFAGLRALTADVTAVYVTGYLATSAPSGFAGAFMRDDSDTTSVDNGGTIIVAANGKRWKRIITGPMSVQWFGAKGDATSDDTLPVQAAFDAVNPGGAILFPTFNGETYKLTDEIMVRKPCTIFGSMGNVYAGQSPSSYQAFAGVLQSNVNKAAFKLVASKLNYAFDQYGVLGVRIQDLMISGPSNGARAVAAITTDTNINAGNYHIRHCHFTNVAVRYFATGIDFTGIAYLNSFMNCMAYNCGTGWKIAKGNGGDNGGQTRWVSCIGVANDTCLSLNEDGSAGSFAVFGCTLSESKFGIRSHEECVLTVSGCEFESLQNGGNGAGIYIEIKEANPNTGSPKTIVGNKFLNSDADIWINKTTTAYGASDFNWPMYIEGNALNSAVGLKVTVPAGHAPMNSQKFVFGASNDGNTSFNFKGRDMRQTGLMVKRQEYAPFTAGTVFILPPGAILRRARVWLTANNAGFTGLKLGNQANDGKYMFFGADSQALNTPVEYTSNLGDKIDGSNNFVNLAFTAGINGAAGVVEVEYFVP